MAAFLERHPRDPFPSEIVWEAGDSKFGLCRWFAIDGITTEEPAAWHVDHNVALVDDIRAEMAVPLELGDRLIGVLDVESFFPQKDRFGLAMRINNVLASPGFQRM